MATVIVQSAKLYTLVRSHDNTMTNDSVEVPLEHSIEEKDFGTLLVGSSDL